MSTEAKIILTATDQTRAGIASARSGIDSLGASARSVTGLLSGLGVSLSVASIAAFAKQAIAGAAALDDMAEATGASVEGLSRIQQVARKTGQDFSAVQDGVLKLTRSLSPFSEGGKAAATAVKAIGLSIDDLRRQAPDQAFEILARALNKFEDGAGKSQVAMALLGKTGAQYLPLLKELAEDQATVAAITAQQAAEAEKLEKSWAALTTTAINFGNAIALKIVPALNQLAGAMKAGGFGGGLAAGITAAFSDNLGANIALAQQRLDKLQQNRRNNNITQGGLLGGVVGIEESHIINTIEALKTLQREQALALGGNAYGNEGRGVETPRKKQIDAVGIAAEETAKKVRGAKKATDDYVGDVFGAAANDVGRLFAKREEQLDQFGFAGSESYMRMLRENLAFERDAWGDLARDRGDDERDRARVSQQASDDAAREWKRASDEIEGSLTDALMRGFESGEEFGNNFAKTLKNLFATLVLRPIIQPIAQAASGAILGAFGMGASGSASASGGMLGGASNLFGLGSQAGSFGGMFSGASLAVADTLAMSGSSLGLIAADTLTFGAAGAASTGAALGMGGAGAAMGALATAAPYIAAAVALYSVLAAEGGGPKTEIRGGAQLFGTPGRYGVDQGLQSLVDSFYSQYSSTAGGLGGTPRGDILAMLRLARDPEGTAGTQLLAGLGGGASYRFYNDSIGRDAGAEQAALSEQLARMMVAALKATDLDDVADKMLAGIDPATASAEQLAAALSAAQKAMEDMAKATDEMRAASQDVLRKMLADAKDRMLTWAQAARGVIGTRIDIAGGELSALDPQGKLSLAQKGFTDISRRAALGDLSAFEGLGQSATDYLGAARSYYASGPGYASIYADVQMALERAQNLAVRQVNLAGSFSDLLQETATGNAANEAGIEAMIAQLKQINARLAAIESGSALAASAPSSTYAPTTSLSLPLSSLQTLLKAVA